MADSSLIPPIIRRSRLAGQASGSLATSAAVQFLNLGTGIVLARLLGPTGKGQLTAVLLWPAVVALVGGLGFWDALTYFTAQSVARKRTLSATALTVVCAQSLILTGLSFWLMPVLLRGQGAEALSASRIYLAWLPLFLVANAALGLLLGGLQVGLFNRVRLSLAICSLLGLLVLALIHERSLRAVVLVYVAANSVQALYGIVSLLRLRWVALRPDVSLIGPMLSYGLKTHLGNVSGYANERADQAMISVILAPAFLGLYSVAVSISSPVILLGFSIAMITLPAVASADAQAKKEKLIGLLRLTLLLSALSAALLFVLAPWLLATFFGRAFLPAGDSTRILLLAAVILSVNRVLSAGLKAYNKPLAAGGGELVANAVTFAALVSLVPLLGIVGAAIASVIAYATSLIYMVWFLARSGIGARELLPTRSELQSVVFRIRHRVPLTAPMEVSNKD
jgi:antigen flippase